MMEYPHEIEIQTFVEVEDEGGGLTQEWQVFAYSEAFVIPIGGSEYYQAQQNTNPVDYDVFIPYRADVLPSMRMVFKGKIMNITAVIPTLLDINGEYEKLCLKGSL